MIIPLVFMKRPPSRVVCSGKSCILPNIKLAAFQKGVIPVHAGIHDKAGFRIEPVLDLIGYPE
jgi:hypothetical protein